jgi:hypothetical protein
MAGLGGAVVVALSLLFVAALELDSFTVLAWDFVAGFDLVVSLDLTFGDGALVRLSAPLLDFVFLAALAFTDLVFFLATMHPSSTPSYNHT